MNDLAQQWLNQSWEDLATAKVLFDAQRFGPCAFYCQQAAEKALKAAIYESGDKPWGHSLPSLLDQVCEVWQVDLADAPSTEVEALDEHYMRPRYPDARSLAYVEYDSGTAEEAQQQAQAILSFSRERVLHVGEDSN